MAEIVECAHQREATEDDLRPRRKVFTAIVRGTSYRNHGKKEGFSLRCLELGRNPKQVIPERRGKVFLCKEPLVIQHGQRMFCGITACDDCVLRKPPNP